MNYLDLIILIVIILLVIFCFRSFKTFIYLMGILELFLRVFNFIATHITIPKVSSFIIKHFPSSIISIINKYTKGILNDILVWVFVIIMFIWLIYLVDYFIKKKK